jgi:PAS domain S-box-containing protein
VIAVGHASCGAANFDSFVRSCHRREMPNPTPENVSTMPGLAHSVGHDQHQESGSSEARQGHYRAIVENAADFAVFAMDRSGRVTDWNQGATHVLGWSQGEILGQFGGVFFTPEDRADGKPEQELQAALSSGRVMDEGWQQRKDGSRFWVLAS